MADPREGCSVIAVELPFAEGTYAAICVALSERTDMLHIPMWRAILQHIEDET